jgi:hypothetical protein
MPGELAHISRCLDLQEQDIVEAIGARDRTRALLAHLEGLSAPNTGVAKVLLVFARMATTACDWIDGDLTIDLAAQGDATRVDAATEPARHPRHGGESYRPQRDRSRAPDLHPAAADRDLHREPLRPHLRARTVQDRWA